MGIPTSYSGTLYVLLVVYSDVRVSGDWWLGRMLTRVVGNLGRVIEGPQRSQIPGLTDQG